MIKKNAAILIKDITAHSGTERAVASLACMLAENGFNVHIISTNSKEGDQCKYYLPESVKIFHADLPNRRITKRVFDYVKYIYRVKRYCRKNNIDFIFGTGHQYNCMMYLFGGNAKKIACEHLNYESCPKYSNYLRKIVYPKLNAVVCLTNGDAKHYYNFVEKSKIYVIPNSLPFTCDTPAKLDSKQIIAVGRIVAQKNFPALIEAAAIIKPELPDWKIRIFGEGGGGAFQV